FVKKVTTLHRKEKENAQPAFAEGFGVAGAHLSRRSEAKEEHPTPYVEVRGQSWQRNEHPEHGVPGGRRVTHKTGWKPVSLRERRIILASSNRFSYFGASEATIFSKRGSPRNGSQKGWSLRYP